MALAHPWIMHEFWRKTASFGTVRTLKIYWTSRPDRMSGRVLTEWFQWNIFQENPTPWIIGRQRQQWPRASTLGGPSLLTAGCSSFIFITKGQVLDAWCAHWPIVVKYFSGDQWYKSHKGKYMTPHMSTDRLQWNIFQENLTLWIIGRQRHQWPRASTLGGPSLLTAGCSY